MLIDEEVAQQNIVAGQAEWEGVFHCPLLVVNTGITEISKENALYLDKVKNMAKVHVIPGGKNG